MLPLQSLIDSLRGRPPLERSLTDMATLLAGAANAWPSSRPLIERRKDYTRTLAYGDDVFEVLLLNWAPGAISALHDHGGRHCWMLVLDGGLNVDDYARLDAGELPGAARVQARGSRLLRAGGVDLRSGRFDLHRVAAADGPARSLHVYAGPLREWLIYDESAQRCETERGTYDDVLTP